MRFGLILRAVVILSFTILCVPHHIYADASLDARVSNLLKSLKERGSYTVLLDFMHWPTEFRAISGEIPRNHKIQNPENLKIAIGRFLDDPTKTLEDEWRSKEAEFTPLQRDILRAALADKLAHSRALWREKNEQLKEIDFVVVKSERDSKEKGLVHVSLGIVNKPEATPWTVSFYKAEKEWYLRPSHNDIDIARILSIY